MRMIDKIIADSKIEGVEKLAAKVFEVLQKARAPAVVFTLQVDDGSLRGLVNYRVKAGSVTYGKAVVNHLYVYRMVVVPFSPGVVHTSQALLMPKQPQPVSVPLMWDYVDSEGERKIVFEALLKDSEVEGPDTSNMLLN